jgi:uncharacterized lipoprotein
MKGRKIVAFALVVLASACTTNSPTAAAVADAPSHDEARSSGGMGSGH